MKKFDISESVVLRIHDVYAYTLEEETRANAVTEHAVLIVKQNGISHYRVGSTDFFADAGRALFLPANTPYSMEVEKEGACTVIEFDLDLQNAPTVPSSFFTDEGGEIFATAKNLLLYWKLQGPAYHTKCLCELYDLITQLSTVNAYADSLVGKYQLIHKSVKYIEKNYRKEDLYTPMLAEMSGIGETYYRSIFQAVFHMPPARYIQRYRVDKAKELLVSSDLSVDAIAKATGFANASYFCKVFKSLTTLTPSEFVEKSRRLG